MLKKQSNFNFKGMSAIFKLRDYFSPRINVLKEVRLKSGYHVLDYGCGPGSYIRDTAKLVGSSGKIYALDLHPLAIRKVENIISRHHLKNVTTIHSDFETGLGDNSIDVILLYDVFHDFTEPDKILQELNRVLKKGGVLSFSDHHLDENSILKNVALNKYFKFTAKGQKTYTFSKK